jgi:hypothetical protein
MSRKLEELRSPNSKPLVEVGSSAHYRFTRKPVMGA